MEIRILLVFCLLLHVHGCISAVIRDLSSGEEIGETENSTRRSNLSCPETEGTTAFSLYVTSVRISGVRLNHTVPPPNGFTEEEWGLSFMDNYNATAEVTYTITPADHCTRDQFRRCRWPNIVPNIVWYVRNDDSNFTQTSVSVSNATGEITTTVIATTPVVRLSSTLMFSLQSDDLSFRYDHRFGQHNFHRGPVERFYSPITFHCHPPGTVRVRVGNELVLFWSFAIKQSPGETKENLMEHIIEFTAILLNSDERGQGKVLYNKLTKRTGLSSLSLEGDDVWRSGLWDPNKSGKIFGEVMELDDGYTVNLKLEFTVEEVGPWMKGTYNMDFGGITTVTHVAIDDNETDTTISDYYQQYNCYFDKDMLSVTMYYGERNAVSDRRYIEVNPGIYRLIGAPSILCEAYGCHIDKLELLKNGQPLHHRFHPDKSDNIVQQGYGGYKRIKSILTHVNEDTFGTYECRVTDKSGNVTSKKIELIRARDVSVKLVEWNADYAVVACRASGDPPPTISFISDQSIFIRSELPVTSFSEFSIHTERFAVAATINITIPTDTLTGMIITCQAHSPYGVKGAKVGMSSWKFPRRNTPFHRVYDGNWWQ